MTENRSGLARMWVEIDSRQEFSQLTDETVLYLDGTVLYPDGGGGDANVGMC